MKVYIILHHWDDEETNGSEIWGVFTDKSRARWRMHALAYEEKSSIQMDRGIDYHNDFSQNDEDMISYGWYEQGSHPDCTFRWEILEEKVVE